ncbi:MAG: site-specific integrase [Bryobacterales bacterium]|nr:site-specific integrase [Bryobacterales bacterium]
MSRCRRHTLVTELAESGTGDEVIMSVAGHVSSAMLSTYSHVRRRRSGAPSTRSPHASARPTKSARTTLNGGGRQR